MNCNHCIYPEAMFRLNHLPTKVIERVCKCFLRSNMLAKVAVEHEPSIFCTGSLYILQATGLATAWIAMKQSNIAKETMGGRLRIFNMGSNFAHRVHQNTKFILSPKQMLISTNEDTCIIQGLLGISTINEKVFRIIFHLFQIQ